MSAVSLGALTLGQMLVAAVPTTHAGSFVLAAMLAAPAIVPVALTRPAQPARVTGPSVPSITRGGSTQRF
jgi:hypothetical protein